MSKDTDTKTAFLTDALRLLDELKDAITAERWHQVNDLLLCLEIEVEELEEDHPSQYKDYDDE